MSTLTRKYLIWFKKQNQSLDFLISFFFNKKINNVFCMCLRESCVCALNISPTYAGFLFILLLISSWSLINPRKRWIHRPIDFPFLINTRLLKANLKFHTSICKYVKTYILCKNQDENLQSHEFIAEGLGSTQRIYLYL